MRSSVYHRNPNARPPIARAGCQQFIIASEDDSNAPIVDLSSGAAVTGLGHSCLPVKDAMRDQISNLCYVHSAQFTAPAIEAAADAVLEHSCRWGEGVAAYQCSAFEQGAVSFFSGGAEAIEAAVKMAMQYMWYSYGDMSGPVQIIGRQHSYHGNSVFTLALGDHPRKKVLKSAFNLEPHVTRIKAFVPELFGAPFAGDELKAYTATCLATLEAELQHALTYKRRAIVVIETVGGTTVAIAPPTVTYLMGVRKLCDKFDAVLIYDEILCANFRTGRMAAWQYYQETAGHNIAPDIFVMGKGITAGYFPMSAVVVSKAIREAGEHYGKVWHTSTNQNHVIGCAALLAAFGVYNAMLPRIAELIEYIDQEIKPMLLEAPGIEAFTGVGLLRGVQFNPRTPGLHLAVKADLMRRGYSVYSDGGTVEGNGNMILFAPPYILNEVGLRDAAVAIVKAGFFGAENHA
jgi:adenosylmethionine-8-amino-7-oxononanoate aminotransferase